MSSIGSRIYNAAEFYTNIVETGASLTYNVSDATVSCADAMFNTTSTGWNLGLKNSLQGCAKYSLGFHDYRKAVDAFRKKQPVPMPNQNGIQIVDMRPMGRRLGEFSGHMINGGCKAVTTGVVTGCATALVTGTISNLLWDAKDLPDIGNFHNASRKLASGVFEVSKCFAQIGWPIAKGAFNIGFAAGQVVVNHPRPVFNTVGMGGAAYLTCLQIVKAGKAESYTRKTGHSALAVLGLGAMVAVPFMNPFPS